MGSAGGGFNPIGDAILDDAENGNQHAFRDALQGSVDEAKIAFGSDQLTVMLWHVTKYHSLVVDGDYPGWFDLRAFPFICPSRVTPAYIASLENWFQDLRDDGDVPGIYVGTVPQVQADTANLRREGIWVRHPDDDEGASLAVFKAGLRWCIDRGAVEIGLDIFNWFRAWRGYPAYTGGIGWGAAPAEDATEDEVENGTFEPTVPKDEDFDLYIESLLLCDPEINNARYIVEPYAPLGRIKRTGEQRQRLCSQHTPPTRTDAPAQPRRGSARVSARHSGGVGIGWRTLGLGTRTDQRQGLPSRESLLRNESSRKGECDLTSYHAVIQDMLPKLYWPLNESGSATKVSDASGLGHDSNDPISPTGYQPDLGVADSPFSPATPQTTCCEFDFVYGTSPNTEYLATDYIDDADEFSIEGKFTICMWIKPAVSSGGILLLQGESASLVTLGLGGERVQLNGPGGGTWISNETVPTDEWQMLAIVFDGTAMGDETKVFLNQNQLSRLAGSNGSGFEDDITVATPRTRIGATDDTLSGYNGRLAGFAMFNYELTAWHIEQLYVAGIGAAMTSAVITADGVTLALEFELPAYQSWGSTVEVDLAGLLLVLEDGSERTVIAHGTPSAMGSSVSVECTLDAPVYAGSEVATMIVAGPNLADDDPGFLTDESDHFNAYVMASWDEVLNESEVPEPAAEQLVMRNRSMPQFLRRNVGSRIAVAYA